MFSPDFQTPPSSRGGGLNGVICTRAERVSPFFSKKRGFVYKTKPGQLLSPTDKNAIDPFWTRFCQEKRDTLSALVQMTPFKPPPSTSTASEKWKTRRFRAAFSWTLLCQQVSAGISRCQQVSAGLHWELSPTKGVIG